MRILMLNTEYPPLGGGQGNANKALFDEYIKYGDCINIDIVTASVSSFRIECYPIGNIYYLDIGKNGKNCHFQSSKNLIFYSYQSYLYSKKLIKTNKYDLLVAWSGIPTGFITMLLSRKYNIPYIVLLRGADVPFYDKRWEKLDKLIFSKLSPIIWRHARSVIANSEGLRDLAYKTSKVKNIDIIHNGIDIDKYTPDYAKRATTPEILCVGRLNKIKGFDLVLKAVSKLQCDCKIVIAGDGPEREPLSNLAVQLGISERVVFLGKVDKGVLLEQYRKATVFCLSSYNEGMSNALLEAMACGLPVISTDVGGVKELINGNGVVVNKGDYQSIKLGLESLLYDRDKIIAFSNKSVEIASKFSWNNVKDKFTEIFSNSFNPR